MIRPGAAIDGRMSATAVATDQDTARVASGRRKSSRLSMPLDSTYRTPLGPPVHAWPSHSFCSLRRSTAGGPEAIPTGLHYRLSISASRF